MFGFQIRYVVCILLSFQLILGYWRINNPQVEPKSAQLLKSARNYLNQGNYFESRERYHYTLAINPDSEEAHLGYEITGKIIELDATRNTPLDTKPLFKKYINNTDAMTYIAFQDIEKANYSNAKQTLFQIIEENPENSKALYGIGLVYAKQNLHMQALQYFFQAIDIHNQIIHYYSAIAQSYTALRDFVKANEYYNRAISIEKRDLINYLGLAYSLAKNGDKLQASRTLKILEAGLSDIKLQNRLKNREKWCLLFLNDCLFTLNDKKNFVAMLKKSK